MSRITMVTMLQAAVLLSFARTSLGRYSDGVNPRTFSEGDEVKLKVNKLTSAQTQLPMDYYQLPYCAPEYGPTRDSENLGEFLAGDRIESSPYRLWMKQEMYCEAVCIFNTGRDRAKQIAPSKVVRAIQKDYHNNWIVDNLSAASKFEDEDKVTTRYWQGFPVGFMVNDKAYIYNHVNIELQYHTVEGRSDKYRIVRFLVQPFSIAHDYELRGMDDDQGYTNLPQRIKTPIRSCKPGAMEHTHYDMVKRANVQPQIASGQVLFTYDVTWAENKTLDWASRWDIYLTLDHAVPDKVHWMSIANSLTYLFLVVSIGSCCIRASYRKSYDRLASDESELAIGTVHTMHNNAQDTARNGTATTPGGPHESEVKDFERWRLVYKDVFRPPQTSPLLLSVACGTGAQILSTAIIQLLLSFSGVIGPAKRGSVLIVHVFFYVLNASIGGYVGGRIYRALQGKDWKRVGAGVAVLYPGFVAILYILYEGLALVKGSSASTPMSIWVILCVLWFGMLFPLSYCTASRGIKRSIVFSIRPPEATTPMRAIPSQKWYVHPLWHMILSGMFPFGAIFVELYFNLDNIWLGLYDATYGFQLIVLFLTVTIIAVQCPMLCFAQLRSENHLWWWRAFWNGASIGIYMMAYAFVYYSQLHASSLETMAIYVGFMLILSVGAGLAGGCVGLLATLAFNQKLYSLIVIEYSDDLHMMESELTTVMGGVGSDDTHLALIENNQQGKRLQLTKEEEEEELHGGYRIMDES